MTTTAESASWAASAGHHETRVLVPGTGLWEVARPLRDTSWWHRRKQERACRRRTNHCWHPFGLIDWWCCMCSADTEGMPPQRCVYCTTPGYQVAVNGRFLATRSRARYIRDVVTSSPGPYVLDFTGVDAITIAFGDELVAGLAAAGHGVTVVGATGDVRHQLVEVLARRGLTGAVTVYG